jgi:hypothetical protein
VTKASSDKNRAVANPAAARRYLFFTNSISR